MMKKLGVDRAFLKRLFMFLFFYELYYNLNMMKSEVSIMKYKILMVDDDRELLKMLNQYFTLKNYTVIIAENGIEAMEKISVNPNIVLLDVNMPGMDGIEVCRRIRDIVSCPIIFLTARVEEEDRIKGLLSGGDDYVTKPFSLKELDARIIAHLKREERIHKKTE